MGSTTRELAALPAVSRVVARGRRDCPVHADVPATIGALLAADRGAHVEPQNDGPSRPTLEDVFLDLTGRALRD